MHTHHITLPANAHILVVKLAGIGDLLLATPALRALRETYPQARIDLLVTPDSAGLLNGWEVIDHVIVLNKYLFDYPQQVLKNPRSLQRLAPLWRELRAGDYDAVLLLHHLTLPFGRLKHQLLMRATGAKWRAGLDNGHGRGSYFTRTRPPQVLSVLSSRCILAAAVIARRGAGRRNVSRNWPIRSSRMWAGG